MQLHYETQSIIDNKNVSTKQWLTFWLHDWNTIIFTGTKANNSKIYFILLICILSYRINFSG